MEPELWVMLLKSFGMLCIVLAVLIFVLWTLRRFQSRGSSAQPGLIRILASHYVGPKEKITLIDVLGEKFLVGITPQAINLLAKIVDKDNVCPEGPPLPESLFRSLLRGKLNAGTRIGEKRAKGPPAA